MSMKFHTEFVTEAILAFSDPVLWMVLYIVHIEIIERTWQAHFSTFNDSNMSSDTRAQEWLRQLQTDLVVRLKKFCNNVFHEMG